MNQFGWSLRNARRAIGWSVDQFAKLCDLPRSLLVEYEQGDRRGIDRDHLERFVDALAGRRVMPGKKSRPM
jgi:transcriptional regulator with XRE-family HTH domain